MRRKGVNNKFGEVNWDRKGGIVGGGLHGLQWMSVLFFGAERKAGMERTTILFNKYISVYLLQNHHLKV